MVNLVDTPGHVDFSGKVTRAMRIIDGAIVVVDAVEGVMAQTESVIRSAISERVKPVLFINKIDRLIRELKLSEKAIQKKLTNIIEEVNSQISNAWDQPNDLPWTVSTSDNTVTFGSALDQWAFTVEQMQKTNLRFRDVISSYQKNRVEDLRKILPIHMPLLNMIINKLPSPNRAQKYRMQKIWKGKIDSSAGLVLSKCDPEDLLIIGISKIVAKSKHDSIAVGRIFSGTIKKGTQIRIFPQEKLHKLQRVTLFMGSRQVVVPSLAAGNICGLIGVDEARAGDTITGQHVPDGMAPFEEITYVSEPVVTIAIEPKRPRELPRLLSSLETISKEDPNLLFSVNEQTGENLLSGLGLLHLEIALKDVEDSGIQVDASDPIVLYRETPKKEILEKPYYSPNGKNSIILSIHPQDDKTEEAELWQKDTRGNVLRYSANLPIPEAAKESLIAGFNWAMEKGPLCAEPMGLTLIKILNIVLSENLAERSHVELMSMIKEAIVSGLIKSEVTLLEPIYSIQTIVPMEFLKEVTGVIISKRGQVENVLPKGDLVTISGLIPVRESFDLSDNLRSKTSGKAIWQTKFSRWQVVPQQRVSDITNNIKKRRGLI